MLVLCFCNVAYIDYVVLLRYRVKTTTTLTHNITGVGVGEWLRALCVACKKTRWITSTKYVYQHDVRTYLHMSTWCWRSTRRMKHGIHCIWPHLDAATQKSSESFVNEKEGNIDKLSTRFARLKRTCFHSHCCGFFLCVLRGTTEQSSKSYFIAQQHLRHYKDN